MLNVRRAARILEEAGFSVDINPRGGQHRSCGESEGRERRAYQSGFVAGATGFVGHDYGCQSNFHSAFKRGRLAGADWAVALDLQSDDIATDSESTPHEGLTLHRSVDHSRTYYKPIRDLCRCDTCMRSRRSSDQPEDHLDDPSGCTYVNPEEVFARLWEEENKANPGINGGHGILQDLMFPTGRRSTSGEQREAGKTEGQLSILKNFWLSARDRTVAATAIQWLGTNCGWSFLVKAVEACGYVLEKSSTLEQLRKGFNSERSRSRVELAQLKGQFEDTEAEMLEKIEDARAHGDHMRRLLMEAKEETKAAVRQYEELFPVALARFITEDEE